MPTGTTYPSVPIPQDNIDSLYQSCLAMRQTIQLLIVNAQTVSSQTLSQASQIFSKKTDHADALNGINNNLTTVNKSITNLTQSIASLQNSVTTLQGQMAAITTRLSAAESNISSLLSRMTIAEGNIVSLQTQINVINTNLLHYLLLAGGTMTGDLDFKEASGVNAIVGQGTSSIRWTVHFGDSNDEFAVMDAAGTPLLWCKQDGTIHVASALVVGAHP